MKDPTIRTVCPFAVDWEMLIRVSSFYEREKVNSRKKGYYGPGPVILGNLLSASVLKIFISGNHLVCRSSQGLVLFLGVTHESKSLFLGVWRHESWLAVFDGTFLTC